MSAFDSVPLAATVGAACTALGGVVGAWVRGLTQAKTASVTARARETVATEETERAALAHDVALVPLLMAEIRALRVEQRADREHAASEREKCRTENEAMRRELDTMNDSLSDLREINVRQGEQLRVVSAELARWHGSIPAGAD